MQEIRRARLSRSVDPGRPHRRIRSVYRREFLAAAGSASLALALQPHAFAARLGGTRLAFVTADLESHIVILDLGTGATVERIRTAPAPRSIEAILGSSAVVAHTEHGLVSLIGVSPLGVRAEVDGFESPRYTCVRPPTSDQQTSSLAYVTDSARGEVVTLDVGRAKVLWRTDVPGPARHISISPDGRTIWTALGTAAERLAVLDASNPRRPRLTRTIVPPFLAHDVVFAPDGRTVWVTSGAERRIAIYRREGRPLRVIAADAPPQHVTFADDKAFVASGDDGKIRRHRLEGELVREARVPVGSYNLTFAHGRIVSPSLGSGRVTVLDRNGRVRAVRRVARAAHDACILVT
jgi:sugar lactone lactonase YvrE